MYLGHALGISHLAATLDVCLLQGSLLADLHYEADEGTKHGEGGGKGEAHARGGPE